MLWKISLVFYTKSLKTGNHTIIYSQHHNFHRRYYIMKRRLFAGALVLIIKNKNDRPATLNVYWK